MSQIQKIQFSNDLGNGTLKGIINGDPIKVPSNIVEERPQDINDPIKSINDDYGKSYVDHYLDHMDVSVQSSAIKHSGRCLVGKSAVASGLPLTGFDIASMSRKSDTDLAVIMTLSTIAGKSIELYYRRHHKLPSQSISTNVDMVTALPITEGKHSQTIDNYRRRYTQSDHVVSIRNFNDVINVHIHFHSVRVMLEGQAAIYAIHFDNDVGLRKSIYQDFATYYPNMAKQIHSYKSITDVNSVLGVDIGEGTTDLAVFHSDGSVNMQASRSTPHGFGHAINSAIDELQANSNGVTSRPQIEKVMSEPDNVFTHSQKSHVINALNDQKSWLANKIANAVSDSLRSSNNSVHLIYVYGGGSIPMERALRGELEKRTRHFNGGADIPVIFINPRYAQDMNVLGLNEVLKSLMQLA